MRNNIIIILTTFFGLITNAQNSNKSTFKIPENEFLISVMINNLEDERKQIVQDLKLLERISILIKDNNLILNSFQTSQINSKEKLIEAYSNFKLKTIDRYEFENISNYELKDLFSEVHKLSYFDYELFFFDNNDITDSNFIEKSEEFKNEIDNKKNSYNSFTSKVENIKKVLNEKSAEIDGKLTELFNHKSQNTDLHRISILIGLPAFCVTILLLFLVPYYLEKKSTTNNHNNNKQYLLDVATVLLLTLTILILGLAKMITGEVLGTLLGGISGYVLNRTMNSNTNS